MTLERLEPFATPYATHANGIRFGGMVVVAGQVGVDEDGSVPPDLAEQARLALRNVIAVVAEGGGRPEQIAHLTWYVLSLEAYHASAKEIGRAFRDAFAGHKPAMTLIGVTGLIDPRCQVEISGLAFVA